jgi:hypothetical protein
MSYALRTSVVFGLCLIVSAAVAAAQAPDWSRANEGICDPVQGATPGLYGLCLAFCEAHTCVPDWTALDPFADCLPSDFHLLALYTQRQQPGDPDMPCVNFTGGCPCFTQEDIDAIPTPYDQCVIDYDFGLGLTTNILHVQGTGAEVSVNGIESRCYYGNGLVDPPIFIGQQINPTEAEDCREILVNTIQADPGQCELLCDPVCNY